MISSATFSVLVEVLANHCDVSIAENQSTVHRATAKQSFGKLIQQKKMTYNVVTEQESIVITGFIQA